jgi:hypothetical protein
MAFRTELIAPLFLPEHSRLVRGSHTFKKYLHENKKRQSKGKDYRFWEWHRHLVCQALYPSAVYVKHIVNGYSFTRLPKLTWELASKAYHQPHPPKPTRRRPVPASHSVCVCPG